MYNLMYSIIIYNILINQITRIIIINYTEYSKHVENLLDNER